MTAVIQTEALTKQFGEIRAIDDVNIAIEQGEIFGFLGPNGAGKTTTIRILTGFLRASSGQASIFGLDCWKDSVQMKERLGFLPDASALYENLNGAELLDYLGRLQNGANSALRNELCERLELSQRDLHRPIKGYSRGMRQKVAIVQAFQHSPDLLILDEPTEGLDPLMQRAVTQLVLDFKARGSTIFMSSHVLPEVERLCQRVAIIRRGKIVALSDVEQLRQETVRRMEVTLANETPTPDLDLPSVLSVEREDSIIRIMIRGDVNPVIKELSKVEIEDMVFERADLEDIFMGYYDGKNEGA